MEYLPRVVDAEPQERLRVAGAVVIEGPRACGKSSTARRIAASEALLDAGANARRMVDADPAARRSPARSRAFSTIWQAAPSTWNQVRRAVDDRGAQGRFILTGSAVPADDLTRHLGAGRFSRLRMRPLSLFEAGRSSGDISLKGLLAGEAPRAENVPLTVSVLLQIVCAGGWPGHFGVKTRRRLRAQRDYLEEIRLGEIRRADLSGIGGRRRDPVKVGRFLQRFLQSLGRNVAIPVSVSRLAAEAGGPDRALKPDTAAAYLEALASKPWNGSWW